MNLNPIYTPLASIQGVVIGSDEWAKAGLHASSHQTGGHGAYGWQHRHRVDQRFASAALSNYLARPDKYAGEPLRHLAYKIAGRPVGWSPEHPDDLASGERAYKTQLGRVLVTGIDLQHFALEPLWAIIDDGDGLEVQASFGPVPAQEAARVVAGHLMASLLGQANAMSPDYIGGRALFRVMDNFVQAFKRDAFQRPRQDAQAFLAWIDSKGLPALEKAPGVHPILGKGGGYCNIYQSISWMLTPVHELAEGFKALGLDAPAARLGKIRRRLSQYLLDIETIKGGDAKWGELIITDAMRTGEGGKPLETLIGAVQPSDIGGDPFYRLWAVMAADICADTLKTQEAEEFRDRVRSKAQAQAKPADKVWLVDRNREYL